jgi:hypothetical protein
MAERWKRMLPILGLIAFIAIAVFLMGRNSRRQQPTLSFAVTQEELNSYREIEARFPARDFAGLTERIESLFASLPAGNPVRCHLAMAYAKMGRHQAEKAAEYLEKDEESFKDEGEALRIGCLGDINLYYLDRPEAAAECYEQVLPLAPTVAYMTLASLFKVYSGHSRTFDREKMRVYLEKLAAFPDSPHFAVATMINLAVSGKRDEAIRKLEWLEAQLPPESLAVENVYSAPVWGWLGEAEKAVEYLEPGLKVQASGYSAEGFRVYCDWNRQSPAYDSIRGNAAFTAMWKRLYAFEPEPELAGNGR